MTYEQKPKKYRSFEKSGLAVGIDYVFFNFKTETEFEVIFFDKENSNKIEEYLPVKHRAKLPVAHIHEKQGQEELYYEDNFFRFHFNLVTQEICMHDILGQFRHCPLLMKLEMAALARKLENM